MKLYIVRHGQTRDNQKGIIQKPDAELAETGKKQAIELAEKLKDIRFDVIFVSPFKRAQQTLQVIKKYHQNIQEIVDDRIRERSFGKWEGVQKEELVKLYPGKTSSDSDLSDIYEIDPGIEHSDSLMRKSGDFLNFLKKNYNDKVILVVAHRQINSALIYTIQHQPYGKYMDLKNGEVLEFIY